MAPQYVFLIFSLVVLTGSLLKPAWTRIFVGFFFLAMALGVNLTMLLNSPDQYPQAGAQALLPVYRWFFTQVVAAATVPLVIALIASEIGMALLILSRGKFVKLGLIAAVIFCLGLAPLGIESVTTPALALAIGLLLRHEYPRSLPEMLLRRTARPVPAS